MASQPAIVSDARGERVPPRRPLGLSLAQAAVRVRAEAVLVLLDCIMVAAAYTGALLLRFDLSVPTAYWERFAWFLPAAILAHVCANLLWGCYGHMWHHASIEEARRLLLAGACAGAVLVLLFIWSFDRMPLSVLVIGPVVATTLLGAVRFQSRLFAFQRAQDHDSGLRILVVGAGSGGAAAVREMRRNPQIGLRPVAVLDDDPASHGRSLGGVRVVGGIDTLSRAVRTYDAHQVLLAIPSGGPEVARRVADEATAAGVPVRVLPEMSEWVHGRLSLREVRELRIDDLLGRQQVNTDQAGVRELLCDRRIVVTGAGGSIGAELTRQIARHAPALVALLDADETHLHDAASDLEVDHETCLVDVRNRDEVFRTFERLRPEIVFHAAAHKHVPILEHHPCAAVATNVLGTANVVDAAVHVGATHLVCISTDKAAQPTSVMAASKWLGEQVVRSRGTNGRRFSSVRFGNVLGSRGSVIPTFQRQIASGGPVTVTDERMERYFMSTSEAVSLVLRAAVVAEPRDILLLEMGEQVNILELAERMIQLCGYRVGTDIEIQITKPRPGENLREALSAADEILEPTASPSVVRVRPVDRDRVEIDRILEQLAGYVERGQSSEARELLLATAGAHRVDGDAAAVARDPHVGATSA